MWQEFHQITVSFHWSQKYQLKSQTPCALALCRKVAGNTTVFRTAWICSECCYYTCNTIIIKEAGINADLQWQLVTSDREEEFCPCSGISGFLTTCGGNNFTGWVVLWWLLQSELIVSVSRCGVKSLSVFICIYCLMKISCLRICCFDVLNTPHLYESCTLCLHYRTVTVLSLWLLRTKDSDL